MRKVPFPVVVAIAVNLAIAISKYAAGFVTGSASMMAEAIHSTVDTGNEALLLVGVTQSRKPPDETHPFGHGQDAYFWSLVVAVVIFGAGGGAAILEGLWHIVQGSRLEDLIWNYIVLGVALVFESVSWAVSYRALRNDAPQLSLLQAVRASRYPSRFVVLLEDSAAIAGLIIALVLGTWLASLFPQARLDGIASILIGLVLICAAVFLIAKTRSLLVGEAADKATVDGIRAILENDADVEAVKRILTMQLSPESVLLNLDLRFRDGVGSANGLPASISRLERAIQQRYPNVKEIFIEAQALAPHSPPR